MQPDPTTMECGHQGMWPNQSLQSQGNAPIETEPMIKNTTHSSIGCNGMANNDDYHGLKMYKNHAKDSTTEGYMQPDPTNMECMWRNQSLKGQGNAPSQVRMMGHSSPPIPVHKYHQRERCVNHNGWPQAWSAIGQPSNSWPPLHRQAAAAHHGTQRIAQLSEEANHQVVKAYSHQPTLDPLLANVCQASPLRLAVR